VRSVILLWLATGLLAAGAQDEPFDAAVFGEIEARNIGSATMSGRITDFAVAGDVLYIGTASGGVWKSEDGAIGVTQIFEDHTQAIGCITVDPNDPEVIWVGTGEINVRNSASIGDGVYKSTDGGETWTHMGLTESERIGEIVVDPRDANVVYVAALGRLWNDHEERGLYKTTDGGETWSRILEGDETTGCVDVDLDPQEPDTLYACMWQVRRRPYFFTSGGPGSGMYKSTDGGETWTEMREGIPEGDLGRIDLAVAPTRPNRIYAMVESEKTGLYRSDDAGHSWALVDSSANMIARPFYLSIIAVDPQDYNRVYNPSYSLTISEDGGDSFGGSMFGGSGVHPDHQAIWINPENPKHIVLGTDGGVYVSYDRARNWRFMASLPAAQLYHVTADDDLPYNVYGGLQDNGSWTAPSAASGGITNAHWQNIGGGDGFHVARDRTKPHYVYWTYQGGMLHRKDMRSEEQKLIQPYPDEGMEDNRFNWNAGFAQSPNGGAIYYGSQYLYKSEDQGDNWTRISPDLTTDDPEKQRQEESGGLTSDVTAAENHCSIFTIAESPLDARLIWVGTDDGNLQVTRDGGETWTNVVANVPDLPANTWVSSVEPGRHQAGVAYATFDGHRTGDRTPYVYKTTDFGATWQSLASDAIESYCHVVRQDYVNPELLFLGTEMGLYISLDDGGSWTRFTGGLPDKVCVKDMVFQQREHDLVLATHGRGIYIIDDISSLRSLTKEVVAQDAVILPNRPSYKQVNTMSFGYGAGGYTAPNPPSGLEITYYLRKRHIFGKLRVEIYDEAGEQVATLPGGKRRGINRVQWSMRLPAPTVARSRALAIGALTGPTVPEGTYTVKLVKGKKTYESRVTLLPDRRIQHSAEDRAAQHETVMELYNAQADLAFISDRIGNLKKQVAGHAEAVDKGRLDRELDQLHEALEALHGTIVDTSESASIFAAKERLRDDVVSLYASVSSYLGRPTGNQLRRWEALKNRMDAVERDFDELAQLDDINKRLERADREPLTLLDRETWQAEKDGASSGGGAIDIRSWKALTRMLTGNPYLGGLL